MQNVNIKEINPKLDDFGSCGTIIMSCYENSII